MTTKVAVVGATGKLGQLVSRVVGETDGFELGATLDSRSPLADMLDADIVVDVTMPGVSQGVVDFALANGKNVLVGTSGWSRERIVALEKRLALLPDLGAVIIPNFSLGSVLATTFAEIAARFFDSMEIVETHQAAKVDSPSGTAVRTAELMGNARAELGPVLAPHTDQRARGQQVSSIPIHSLRMDGVLARQDVIFGGTGETLTVSHHTLDPRSYEAGIAVALGATVAARGITVGLGALIDLGAAPTAGSRAGGLR